MQARRSPQILTHSPAGGYPGYIGRGNPIINNMVPGEVVESNGNPSVRTWTAVAAGWYHTCAIEQITGDACCFGINSAGQLGIGTSEGTYYTLTKVVNDHRWTAISAGYFHTCAIEAGTQHIFCWGENKHGQVGAKNMVCIRDLLGPYMEQHQWYIMFSTDPCGNFTPVPSACSSGSCQVTPTSPQSLSPQMAAPPRRRSSAEPITPLRCRLWSRQSVKVDVQAHIIKFHMHVPGSKPPATSGSI